MGGIGPLIDAGQVWSGDFIFNRVLLAYALLGLCSLK